MAFSWKPDGFKFSKKGETITAEGEQPKPKGQRKKKVMQLPVAAEMKLAQ